MIEGSIENLSNGLYLLIIPLTLIPFGLLMKRRWENKALQTIEDVSKD